MGTVLQKSSSNSLSVPCSLFLVTLTWGINSFVSRKQIQATKLHTSITLLFNEKPALFCTLVAARAWHHQSMVVFPRQEAGRVEARATPYPDSSVLPPRPTWLPANRTGTVLKSCWN